MGGDQESEGIQLRVQQLIENPRLEFVQVLRVSLEVRQTLLPLSGKRKRQRRFSSLTFLVRNSESGEDMEESFWLSDLKSAPGGMKLLKKFYYGKWRNGQEVDAHTTSPPSSGDRCVDDNYEPPVYEDEGFEPYPHV